jgi:hypothetical protein
VSAALAPVVKPGGRVVLCIVGPFVPWEWAWFTAHGHPLKALRRLERGGATWRGVKVHYPTIAKARRAFEGDFRILKVGGLGILVPPPYTEKWAVRHADLVARLDRLERKIETWPLVPWLGDHYLLALERR